MVVNTIKINKKENQKSHIIYFRSSSIEDSNTLLRLQEDSNSIIEVCDTWASLMTQINIMSSLLLPTPLLLIDIDIFEQQNVTVTEIVNMISTMYHCLPNPIKMKLAVVAGKSCNLSTIKYLQEAEILGILPDIKSYDYERLLNALNNVLSYKIHWPKDIIETLTGISPVKIISLPGVRLTERQSQVLSLVCNRGLSNKKIAQALKIAESTVKVHMSAIFKEYGVRNRTQLVLAASPSLKI